MLSTVSQLLTHHVSEQAKQTSQNSGARKTRQADYYLQYLAIFSQSKSVVVEQDIYNQQGALIIPADAILNPKISKQLLGHTLQQPIEFNVGIKQTLSSNRLQEIYQKIILNNPDLNFLNTGLEVSELLVQGCDYINDYPIVWQKLTVMQSTCPDLFMHALISGYMCLSVSKKMGEKPSENLHAFVAGLIHDLPMLSLNPKLLNDDLEYSPEQWREMQSHCEIGYDKFSMISGFPESISLAILEHHEHADGSGYPYGKSAPDLSITGQIVALVDTCIGIYSRESTVEKLGIDALLPVLEMNKEMFLPSVYTAATDILSAIPCQLRRVYSNEDMPEVINGLMLDNEEIQHDYCVLYGLVTSVKPHLKAEALTHTLINMAARINKSLIASGLLKNEHSEWMVISCGAQQEYDYVAIEYLEVMYGEIRWQIKQLGNLVYLLVNDHLINEQIQIHKIERGLLDIAHYHQNNQHFNAIRL